MRIIANRLAIAKMSPYIKLVLQELQATTRNVRRYGTTGVRITPFEKSTWDMHTTAVVRITRVANMNEETTKHLQTSY